jgi:hypothetical protein
MEAASTSETSVSFCKTTRRYSPENSHLQSSSSWKPKSSQLRMVHTDPGQTVGWPRKLRETKTAISPHLLAYHQISPITCQQTTDYNCPVQRREEPLLQAARSILQVSTSRNEAKRRIVHPLINKNKRQILFPSKSSRVPTLKKVSVMLTKAFIPANLLCEICRNIRLLAYCNLSLK